MEYKIVQWWAWGGNAADYEVPKLLAEGWRPQGGVSVIVMATDLVVERALHSGLHSGEAEAPAQIDLAMAALRALLKKARCGGSSGPIRETRLTQSPGYLQYSNRETESQR